MKKLLLIFYCLIPVLLLAQSADDYFHTAANYYVNANKKSAQKTIKEGIQKFPDDQQLNTLASKIEELPDPQEDEQNKKQQQQQQQEEQEQQQQQQQQQRQQQQQDKRQLDALQQNERQTQQKVAEDEMKKGGKSKQEKDW